jgi:hypothetical protein
MTTEWITRLADDERKRDALRSSERDAATRKADLANRLGRRMIDELGATVTHDLDAFRREFPDDRAREVSFEGEGEGGFVVRKPGHPAVSLSVAPRWDVASVCCRYCFTSDNGLPARQDRFDLVFIAYGDDAARFRHESSGQVFAALGSLSEYLLTPVFTGRPR